MTGQATRGVRVIAGMLPVSALGCCGAPAYRGERAVVAVLDSTQSVGAVPAGAGTWRWADLDQREIEAGIEARQPFLIDPAGLCDPVLARFAGRSRFTWLAEGTREAYAKDYRLFFSFLWQRGKYWHEVDSDDHVFPRRAVVLRSSSDDVP